MARCPFDPHPRDAEAIDSDSFPLVRSGDGRLARLVASYDDCKAVLSDPGISVFPFHDSFPHPSQGRIDFLRQAFDREGVNTLPVTFLDDPDHARIRRMILPGLTVRSSERLRPAIRSHVTDLLDAASAHEVVDYVAAVAKPLPTRVIADLFGAGPESWEIFHRAAHAAMGTRNPNGEEVRSAADDLNQLIDSLIVERIDQPSDDLLSRLVHDHLLPGLLSTAELHTLAFVILTAGHDTTVHMTAMSLLALQGHPEQWDLLCERADDMQFVARAVEELLRYITILNTGRRRVAISDVRTGGKVLREGEGVIVANELANRDPLRFPEPERLDLRRDATGHIAFGFGIHQCVGQSVARVELQEQLRAIALRYPEATLASPHEHQYVHGDNVYGVEKLDLRLGLARSG
jgi:cytochrome P450